MARPRGREEEAKKAAAGECPVMSGQLEMPQDGSLPRGYAFDGTDPSGGACPFLKALEGRDGGEAPLPPDTTFTPDPYWARIQAEMDRPPRPEGGMTLRDCFKGMLDGSLLKQLCAGGTS
mmetsp:Transcript_4369/g.10692  ORF Transcript_4369/g.10692 Transcript_4369/m.10692 type:complete len:120 (-) Transcript_4369:674-1033(-)|eukprot:CAMPEP_0179006560 /NCGR_PEP_ID=MMETSP0795-20121207/14629_1 /TAXON_ID=88552 /ORGANISM="Amoebophrya sp., Strain Ameob2" /LENGTH=119 /DNA_ID=CAMNT_0020701349 /DNA_START=44 /DNA_END=403 /DNA_ORIENTATION=-